MNIKIKPSRQGLLHKKLGIAPGQPISLAALMQAKGSPSSSANSRSANR